MPLPTGTQLGAYQVTASIGAGGMGEVYRARDKRLNRDVALKVLPSAFAEDPDRLARFEREAQLLASLNHPHIATLYGLEESGGIQALVMELVEGPTLGERIAAGALPVNEALAIARQIADAFEYAHSKGVIHRDLKPANVKLTPDGSVKVLDFGLAKAMSGERPAAGSDQSATLTLRATVAGLVMGTASYMSPEQARGEDVDKRSDIWAFGVLLHEVLTGTKMFSGATVSDTLAAVLMKEPDWSALPPDTPAPVRKLLRRCLIRDRKKRLPDIAMARLEIDEPPEPAPAPPEPAAAPTGPVQERRSVLPWAAAAGLCAIVAITVSAIHFLEKPPERQAVRFIATTPDKAHFDGAELSPDGRRIAVIVHAETGTRQIGLRQLGSVEVQVLPGTENVSNNAGIAWSPDSRSVVFYASGKLKRIDPGAGPPMTLADVAPFSFTWGENGILMHMPGGGLQRLSPGGGAPVPVSNTSAQSNPRFLPRGSSYLCTFRDDKQGKTFAALASLDAPEVTRLMETTGSEVRFAPDSPSNDQGHLLFTRGNALMAQRFDAAKRMISGEPWLVADNVLSARRNQYSASWNGLLTFRTGSAATEGASLTLYDREGRKQASPQGGFSSVDLSRDGSRLVAQVGGGNIGNEPADLWHLQLASGIRSRFTFHPATDSNPVWSPDGAKIVFGSPREKPGTLFQKVSSGAGPEELLLAFDLPVHATDWSLDGKHILYTSLDPKTKADIWVLPLTSAPPAGGDTKPRLWLQTEFNESHGQFSSDGRYIAYESNETGTYEIYVRPFPNAASGKWQISSGGGAQPRWRRDGKELFYLDESRKIMSVDVHGAGGGPGVFQHSTPKPLFDSHALGNFAMSTSHRRMYAAAPDGKRFYVLSTGDERDAAPITVMLNWAKSP
ncbi:MAG: serine/threonine-protein kinase [Acidobacteriia bacterium]|nr:serine/threonine-protein kinase [Terriglobia bacterium]